MTARGGRECAAEEALRRIPRGGRILIGSGAGAPGHLLRELVRSRGHFCESELVHISTLGEAPYLGEECRPHFRLNTFFVSGNTREAVQAGHADYTPVSLSEIPRLLGAGRMALCACLVQVAPGPDPDAFSLGTNADILVPALRMARLVIAQVNPRMPYTFGQTEIRRGDIDFLVPWEEDLPEAAPVPPDAAYRGIGAHVAGLIPDGATLQLGIGRVHEAVAAALAGKNDLGIHTEYLSDGLMALLRNGNVTGARKLLDRGLAVTSFAQGSRELYRCLDRNPGVRFMGTEYVNDARTIAAHGTMAAVNSALKVDITGNAVSDCLGSAVYSGIGGQLDFLRGAGLAARGIPVIALPATAKDGTVSRIVFDLEAGAGEIVPRGDIHYVVTEYGVADLRARTLEERALAIIEIAHPAFRAELLERAKDARLVRRDAPLYALDTFARPVEEPGAGAGDVRIRPMRPSDERKLLDFFYSHDPESVYLRYGNYKKEMRHREAMSRLEVREERNMAVAAVAREGAVEAFRAVARYQVLEGTRQAEAALIVGEGHRRQGLGARCLRALGKMARDRGVEAFVFYIAPRNQPMLDLFRRLYPRGKMALEDQTYICTATLGEASA